MAYFIALGVLSLAGIVGTAWLIRTDGYGRIPTDPTRTPQRERAEPVPAVTPSARPAAREATLDAIPAARAATRGEGRHSARTATRQRPAATARS